MTDGHRLRTAFAGHRALRTCLQAGIDAHLGVTCEPDDGAVGPTLIDCGFYFLGGDYTSDGAVELAARIGPGRLTLVPDDGWRRVLEKVWGARFRRQRRWSFAGFEFSRQRLVNFENAVPDGFRIVRLDAETAAQLSTNLDSHAPENFATVSDFLHAGGGFAAHEGATIVGAACCFMVHEANVEVAVTTHPTYRHLGLATAACAAFLLDSWRRGLRPSWDAANAASLHLGMKLGFQNPVPYDAYFQQEGVGFGAIFDAYEELEKMTSRWAAAEATMLRKGAVAAKHDGFSERAAHRRSPTRERADCP